MRKLAIFSLLLLCPNVWGHKVGAWTTSSYEDNWQPALPHGNARTASFVNEMRNGNEVVFHAPLDGGVKIYIEDTADEAWTERADIVWLLTHGATYWGVVEFAMWEKYESVMANRMRLGDEQVGTSILVLYTCDNLVNDSTGSVVGRWSRALKGGLRLVVGSADYLLDSGWSINIGSKFAKKIKSGQPIAYSWRDAFLNDFRLETLRVLTCSNKSDNSYYRVRQITFGKVSDPHSFLNHPRIRDDQCTSYAYVTFKETTNDSY